MGQPYLLSIITSFILIIEPLITSSQITISFKKRYTPLNLASKFTRMLIQYPLDSNIMTNHINYINNIPFVNIFNTQYYGHLLIGTPSQNISVLFDTGSEVFWLSNIDSPYAFFKGQNGYNKTNSNTFFETDFPWSVKYGQGSISGHYSFDLLNISTLNQVNLSFVLANRITDLELECNGVIGLGPQSKNPNFIDLAYTNGYIESNIFGFYLDTLPLQKHDNQNSPNDGYIAIGYIPQEYVNDIVYLENTVYGYWGIDLIGLEINGVNSLDIMSTKALIDTGTSFVVLTTPSYKRLINAINATNLCTNTHGFRCKCGTINDEYMKLYPNITIYTKGYMFIITPYDYMLNPNPKNNTNDTNINQIQCIIGASPGAEKSRYVILGDVFIRKSYIVYSKSNMSIGFSRYDNKLILYRHKTYNILDIILLFIVMVSLILLNYFYQRGITRITIYYQISSSSSSALSSKSLIRNLYDNQST